MQVRMGNGSRTDSQVVVKMYELGPYPAPSKGNREPAAGAAGARARHGPGLPPDWPCLLLGFIHKREASVLLYLILKWRAAPSWRSAAGTGLGGGSTATPSTRLARGSAQTCCGPFAAARPVSEAAGAAVRAGPGPCPWSCCVPRGSWQQGPGSGTAGMAPASVGV